MASTYSPNLRLELIGTGDQQGTWGITTNTNLGTLLEQAIGGYETVTVSDAGDTTLTANNGSTDQSRNMVLNLTGTISAARTVICPAIEKLYVVRNATTGGFAVTFKVSGQTGVTIPNGSTYLVYVNGTDAVAVTGSIASQLSNNVAITGGSISGVTISNATFSNATFSNATVSNSTLSNVSVVANASSLGVRDSDGSNVLSIAAGSNLTSNRVFTLTTGDAARTLDISAGNVTVSTAGANLIDDADASAQRTTLGLGTAAVTNTSSTTEVLTGTAADRSVTPDALAALWEQGSNVASATTISLGEGGYFIVTGTTTITDIDFATDKAGRVAWVRFAGALTLTHNATTLILPGGANITTAAGDTACFVSEGADAVRCSVYQKASGLPVVSPSSGGAFILGNISTAGNIPSASLGSLVLTDYKVLQLLCLGVRLNSTAVLQIGNSSSDDVSVMLSPNSASAFNALITIDLADGKGVTVGNDSAATPKSIAKNFDTALSTTTTTIYVQASSDNMDAGEIRVIGYK